MRPHRAESLVARLQIADASSDAVARWLEWGLTAGVIGAVGVAAFMAAGRYVFSERFGEQILLPWLSFAVLGAFALWLIWRRSRPRTG